MWMTFISSDDFPTPRSMLLKRVLAAMETVPLIILLSSEDADSQMSSSLAG